MQVVAYCELEWQAYHLQEVRRLISQGDVKYGGWRRAWDETAELVAMSAVAGKTTREQRGGAWQVCVSHITFFWGNCNDAQVYVCVTPPLPLLSNSAENINSALTLHPLMKPIMDFKQWLDEHVDFFFELHEADAHPANSRLHAFWRETGSTANKPRLSTLVNCMNHQTNLALVSAVHLVQISVINSMYTAVRFLKMSGRSAFKC
jgi:hypothetical protein